MPLCILTRSVSLLCVGAEGGIQNPTRDVEGSQPGQLLIWHPGRLIVQRRQFSKRCLKAKSKMYLSYSSKTVNQPIGGNKIIEIEKNGPKEIQ